MKSMDCTDIRVLLSGLIDDEVDAETRYEAERHIASCDSCATLVSRAEALDGLVVSDLEAWHGADRVSDEFVGAVLSRTVYGQRRPQFGERWTTWTGWIAAAAALIMAMTVWVMDRQLRDARDSDDGSGAAITQTAYRAGPELRSSTLTWPPADEATRPAALVRKPTVTREDAEVLYTTAIVLEMLAETASEDADEIARMRRIVEYDQLLSRLASARTRLPDADQPAVHAAEALLTRLLMDDPDADGLRELRNAAGRLELSTVINAMSDRTWVQPPA